MAVEFKARLDRLGSNVWDLALIFPKKEVERLDMDGSKRVVCTINGEISFHGALMSAGDGNLFINTNKELRKKAGISMGENVMISLIKDESKYGMPLPEELEAAWDLDQEAYAVFHTLTMGKQRSLIHVIGLPKSPEIRIKKALVMLEYLKSVNGNLDFKELNQAFKDANRK